MKPKIKITSVNYEELFKIIEINNIDECWIWSGVKDSTNYGLHWNGKNHLRVHRILYQLFNGKLEEHLIVDHKCRNRLCCNPDHLRQVTYSINSRENSISEPAKNAAKTHCPKKHEYNKENTYLDPSNRRHCKVCESIRKRKSYEVKS